MNDDADPWKIEIFRKGRLVNWIKLSSSFLIKFTARYFENSITKWRWNEISLLWIFSESPLHSEYSIFLYLIERHGWRASTTEVEECSDHQAEFRSTFESFKDKFFPVFEWEEFSFFYLLWSSLNCWIYDQKRSRMLAQFFFLLFHFWAETIDFSFCIELRYFVTLFQISFENSMNLNNFHTLIHFADIFGPFCQLETVFQFI